MAESEETDPRTDSRAAQLTESLNAERETSRAEIETALAALRLSDPSSDTTDLTDQLHRAILNNPCRRWYGAYRNLKSGTGDPRYEIANPYYDEDREYFLDIAREERGPTTQIIAEHLASEALKLPGGHAARIGPRPEFDILAIGLADIVLSYESDAYEKKLEDYPSGVLETVTNLLSTGGQYLTVAQKCRLVNYREAYELYLKKKDIPRLSSCDTRYFLMNKMHVVMHATEGNDNTGELHRWPELRTSPDVYGEWLDYRLCDSRRDIQDSTVKYATSIAENNHNAEDLETLNRLLGTDSDILRSLLSRGSNIFPDNQVIDLVVHLRALGPFAAHHPSFTQKVNDLFSQALYNMPPELQRRAGMRYLPFNAPREETDEGIRRSRRARDVGTRILSLLPRVGQQKSD